MQKDITEDRQTARPVSASWTTPKNGSPSPRSAQTIQYLFGSHSQLSDSQRLSGLYHFELVHQEFAVRRKRDGEVRERSRRRTLNLGAVAFEFAAVAWTRDQVCLRLPLRIATQVSAYC